MCVVIPAVAFAAAPATRPQRPSAGPPYRGIAVLIFGANTEQAAKAIDEIATTGADTVEIDFSFRQENGSSTQIYLDQRFTPTPEQIAQLIDAAHAKALRVLLVPRVLLDNPRGNEWRGSIHPTAWPEWFDSYRSALEPFARTGQEHGAEVFCIGSELVSSETQINQWNQTIDSIRQTYHGHLTYCANWDHYAYVPFWNQLDFIGMNAYWKMGSSDHPDPSVEQILQRWDDIRRILLVFKKSVGKPILLMEVGWCSLDNTAYEPWDYTRQELPQNLSLQNRMYEAFFKTWTGDDALAGFVIYEWEPPAGKDDKGYTPVGKPAEQTLRDWMKKPWRKSD